MPKSTPQSFMIAIINQPMALRMPRTFDRIFIFFPISSYFFDLHHFAVLLANIV